MTFTGGTGGKAQLGGDPAADTGGQYKVTFTASNGVAPNAVVATTLTVDQAPKLTSASSDAFTVGQAGSFQATASGYPAPAFTENGTLPAGLTLTSSGALSGIPAAGSGGIYPITVMASNGTAPSASQAFTLTVFEAPAITSAASATFTPGQTGSVQVTARGYPAPSFTESGSLPAGLTFYGTGKLSGVPAAGSAGSYPITITASNGVGTNATQAFTLTVDNAPAITSADATTFAAGQAGSFQVTASGNPAPTFTETGALPSGVTFSAAGVLSGTPAAGTGGTYPVTITASNGVSPDGLQFFTLTVSEPPAITSADATTFTAGQPGSFQVTSTGSPSPTFTETGGLPAGITFYSSGQLFGTPATGTGGSYPITITAHNGSGSDATQSFTLAVDEAPAITSASSTTFTAGNAGSFQVTATGYPAPTITETGVLPSGVTLSAAGLLSGTAATGGSFPITITAHNDASPDATQSFVLTVDGAPAITSATIATFTTGHLSGFQVTATGYPAPTFTEAGALPKGVTFTSGGLLSGTPAAGTGGNYPLSITASNGIGTRASQAFTLTIGQPPAIRAPHGITARIGHKVRVTIRATGFPAPKMTWSGKLPKGLKITAHGAIATLKGTVSASARHGRYQIKFMAANSYGRRTATITITVR